MCPLSPTLILFLFSFLFPSVPLMVDFPPLSLPLSLFFPLSFLLIILFHLMVDFLLHPFLPKSLFFSIVSPSIISLLSDGQFSSLIDSGSSDCFIDRTFINKNTLPTYSVTPLQLCLFDGTTNQVITQAIDLPIRFASGVVTLTTFFVTPLDGSCTIVLGHNWLTRFNLLIDWVTSSISFRTSVQTSPVPPSSAKPLPDSVLPVGIPILDTPSTPGSFH